MEIPSQLTAGDLWSWTDTLSDYPSPTWVLTYWFRAPSGYTPVGFSVAGTPSSGAHAFSYAAASSNDYQPGTYDWIARAVNGTNVVTVGRGQLEVLANIAEAEASRTFNQRCLDAIEAVMENRATTDQASMQIKDVSLQRMTWDELRAARSVFARRVAAELGYKPGRHLVRI